MDNVKKELEAFKKATRAEISEVRKTMDDKFRHLGQTMDNGFDRLITAIDQFSI